MDDDLHLLDSPLHPAMTPINPMPSLSKQQSFQTSTISDWSTLQDDLQLQYSLLTKENEQKNDRCQTLTQTLHAYYNTLLRFKELKRNFPYQNIEKQCVLGYAFEQTKIYIERFLFMLMENHQLFAQIIYHSQESLYEEFIFDVLTFLYDPVVGAGLENGIFVFMKEFLLIEIEQLTNPAQFFENSRIGLKFLCGFNRRPECQLYLQQILSHSLNILMNVKDPLDLNPRHIYDQIQTAKEQKETAKSKDQKKRKTILGRIQQLVMGDQEEKSKEVYQSIIDTSQTKNPEVEKIIREITPIIASQGSTPLGRIVDRQSVEDTATMLYDRRSVTSMIISDISRSLLQELHKMPFIVRALANLLMQLFKLKFPNLDQREYNNILINYLIHKWVSAEFQQTFITNCPEDRKQFALANVGIISRHLLELWRGENMHGLSFDITYIQINNYLAELIQLPKTQCNYYIQQRQEKHFQGYMLSLADLKLLVDMTSKCRFESVNPNYKNLKGLCEQINKNAPKDGDYFSPVVIFKGQQCKPQNVHFMLTKFSELYSANYVDLVFKFSDQSKIKVLPEQAQEEMQFIQKAKQVVSQFLISIDRISQLAKLRYNVVLSFDNLIQMYKDSYENKGITIKQYENISSQLYANYLMSIYKMIPQEYLSNNLNKLCQEISEEFYRKLSTVYDMQAKFYDMYLKSLTQLQTNRNEIKAYNRILKKQELQRKLILFFKSLKIPCLLSFKGGWKLERVQDMTKYRSFDPTLPQKITFLQQLNSSELAESNCEIVFQNAKDFIDIVAGMNLLKQSLEGSQETIEVVQKIFETYIQICEDKMVQQQFYMQISGVTTIQAFEEFKKHNATKVSYSDWSSKASTRQLRYQLTCFETFEKLLAKKIYSNYMKSNPISEDIEFYAKCLDMQYQTLAQHGIPDMEEEKKTLEEMSVQLKSIDTLLTPLQKLETVRDCLMNINTLMSCSGIGGANEGSDILTPIFIYLLIQAAPRFMKTSLNLINAIFNLRRWQNTEYGFALTQLNLAVKSIMNHQ